MYCENCGAEMKAADKFCEKCGNKNPKTINTEEKAEVNSKKDIKMKEMSVSKIKKYGVIVGIVVLLLLSFTVISKQVKKNSYIKAVQVMAPKRYPCVTFKEAFGNKDLFELSNWEYYVSKDKSDMVKFTGTIINGDNEKGVMEAYFWITGKNDISFHDCEFDMGDGADSNTKSVYGIYTLEEVFSRAYESKNYVLPEELYIDTWSLDNLAFFEITERFAPVKYVKATSDMINKDIPVSATVMAETEPSTTVAVVETTPAETKPAATTVDAAIEYYVSEYILPESNTRVITDAEVSALTSEQLRIAVNEIYARHGRKFNNSELQAWFNDKSWYNGNIAPENFSESVLSQVEKDNIAKLSAAQNRSKFTAGWMYGTYEIHVDGFDAIAEIGWSSGEEVDYIYIVGNSGMYAGEYTGVVTASNGDYYITRDEYGNQVNFKYNGIDAIEIDYSEGDFGGLGMGFDGVYKKTEDLSQYVS